MSETSKCRFAVLWSEAIVMLCKRRKMSKNQLWQEVGLSSRQVLYNDVAGVPVAAVISVLDALDPEPETAARVLVEFARARLRPPLRDFVLRLVDHIETLPQESRQRLYAEAWENVRPRDDEDQE